MENIIVKVPSGSIRVKDARCPKGCRLHNPDKLMSGKPVVTVIARSRGVSSPLHFNSYFGLFEYETDLEVFPGDILDLSCPHCAASLGVDELCTFCRVPMFALQLPDGGEVRACPLVGCRNHRLTIVDLDAQLAAYYNEERRPKM